jgi:UDP-2-acetamido-3-amino-2,3-dideoxy-glucuronate N-acetyltransferase
MSERPYFVHESAYVDEPVKIGDGTRIWHFAHVMSGATIGERCNLGQNVFVATGVTIGNNVKIQNNVSIYEGVELEDDVFCGPSCVFTNMPNPRSQIVRKSEYAKTVVKRGASIGANATIVCPVVIGRYAFIAAGAVVTKGGVPDYAFMAGVPARRRGWMSRHGHRLTDPDSAGVVRCPESGWRYAIEEGVLRCLDHSEDEPLPVRG